MTDRNGIIFERLEIDCDAIRGSDSVLPAIPASDGTARIISSHAEGISFWYKANAGSFNLLTNGKTANL